MIVLGIGFRRTEQRPPRSTAGHCACLPKLGLGQYRRFGGGRPRRSRGARYRGYSCAAFFCCAAAETVALELDAMSFVNEAIEDGVAKGLAVVQKFAYAEIGAPFYAFPAAPYHAGWPNQPITLTAAQTPADVGAIS
jgi:hypothetical protein